MERRSVISIFVTAAQHVLEGRARVKPHFQNVGALGVVGCIGCPQNFFCRGAAPCFDAAFFNDVGSLVQNFHGTGMQLARIFVQEEGHRHAPAALTRNAPVRAVGNHVAQTRLAVFWIEVCLIDGIECQLAQSFGRFVCGENAKAFVHANKPLRCGTVDDGRFVAPAMWVAVGDAVGGHEPIAFTQHFNDARASFPNVHTAKQGQVFGIAAIALNGVQDVVVGQAVGHTRVEVINAVSGRRVNNTGTVLRTHIVGHINRGEAFVAFVHVVQRVLEIQAAQFRASGGGHHFAFKFVTL